MKRTVVALVLSLMLLTACASMLSKTGAVIPDKRVPHRVAEEAVIYVWARNKSGQLVKTKIRLLENWWVASPQVVEP